MKRIGYQFNEFGVCINPSVPFRTAIVGGEIEVSTAQVDNVWVQGFRVSTPHGGLWSPVSINFGRYNSEKEAIYDAMVQAEQWIIEAMRRAPRAEYDEDTDCFVDTEYKANVCRRLLKRIAEYKATHNPKQLELF